MHTRHTYNNARNAPRARHKRPHTGQACHTHGARHANRHTLATNGTPRHQHATHWRTRGAAFQVATVIRGTRGVPCVLYLVQAAPRPVTPRHERARRQNANKEETAPRLTLADVGGFARLWTARRAPVRFVRAVWRPRRGAFLAPYSMMNARRTRHVYDVNG